MKFEIRTNHQEPNLEIPEGSLVDCIRVVNNPGEPEEFELDLSDHGLTCFDAVYKELKAEGMALSKLAHLNLSKNNLTTFLRDEGQSCELLGVRSLNVLDNPALQVKETVATVVCLFPNLESLDLNLSEEQDVSYILSKMPRLVYLNGVEVESDLVLESQAREEHDGSGLEVFRDSTSEVNNSLRKGRQQRSANKQQKEDKSRDTVTQFAVSNKMATGPGAMQRIASRESPQRMNAGVEDTGAGPVEADLAVLSGQADQARDQGQDPEGNYRQVQLYLTMLESNETNPGFDPDRQLSEIREETPDQCETSAARALLTKHTNESNQKSSFSSFHMSRGVGAGLVNLKSEGKRSQVKTTCDKVSLLSKQRKRPTSAQSTNGQQQRRGSFLKAASTAKRQMPEKQQYLSVNQSANQSLNVSNLLQEENRCGQLTEQLTEHTRLSGEQSAQVELPQVTTPNQSQEKQQPHLKPADLEDIATVFDRVRLLYTNKEKLGYSALGQPKSKKLINKAALQAERNLLDQLAVEFDALLTQVMMNLSTSLKDPTMTDSRKWAEIEACKLQLLHFCSETAGQFLTKYKSHILGQEAKELSSIFAKIHVGMQGCFHQISSLLLNKKESELQERCHQQITAYSCQRDEALQQLSEVQDQLKEHQTKQEQLESSLKQTEDRLERANKEIKYQKEQTEKLARQCVEKDKYIAHQQQGISESQHQLNAASAQLHDKRQRDRSRTEELARKNGRADSQIAELRCQLRDKTKQFEGKDKSVRKLKEDIKEREANLALQHWIIKYLLQKHQLSEDEIMNQINSINESTDLRILEPGSTDSPQKRRDLLNQVLKQGTTRDPNSLSQMIEPVSAFDPSSFLRSWRKEEKPQPESQEDSQNEIQQRSPSKIVGQKNHVKSRPSISKKSSGRIRRLRQDRSKSLIQNDPQPGNQAVDLSPGKQSALSESQPKHQARAKSQFESRSVSKQRGGSRKPSALKSRPQGSKESSPFRSSPKVVSQVRTKQTSMATDERYLEAHRDLPEPQSQVRDQLQEKAQRTESLNKGGVAQALEKLKMAEFLDNDKDKRPSGGDAGQKEGTGLDNAEQAFTFDNQHYARAIPQLLVGQPTSPPSSAGKSGVSPGERAQNYRSSSCKRSTNGFQIVTRVVPNEASSGQFTKRSKSTPSCTQRGYPRIGDGEKIKAIKYQYLDDAKLRKPKPQISVKAAIRKELNPTHPFTSVSEPLNKTQLNIVIPSLNLTSLLNSSLHSRSGNYRSKELPPLTLKQVHDLIFDIYQSKVALDCSFMSSNDGVIKPRRETMEQYLITYLQKKYGLKSIVLEHSKAIAKAINFYSEADQQVNLFSMVLKHQVDEDFMHMQQQMQLCVKSIIKNILKGNKWYKSQREVETALESIESGKQLMEQSMWNKVLQGLYARSEAETLGTVVRNKAYQSSLLAEDLDNPSRIRDRKKSVEQAKKALSKPKLHQRQPSVSNVQSRYRVSYKAFVEIVLRKQLLDHLTRLSSFMHHFGALDIDADGVLDQRSFETLYKQISHNDGSYGFGLEESQTFESLLSEVDPRLSDKIVLSDIIQFFIRDKLITDGTEHQRDESNDDSRNEAMLLEQTQQTAGLGSLFSDSNIQHNKYMTDQDHQARSVNQQNQGSMISNDNKTHMVQALSPTSDCLSLEEQRLNDEIMRLDEKLMGNRRAV